MSDHLTISILSEDLEIGSPEEVETDSPEEVATLGMLTVTANGSILTIGVDTDTQDLRRGPYVPGYPVAEWLAWNWWRLRWELARPSDPGAVARWEFSHCLGTIGDGYDWPNITIQSDGVNSFLWSDSDDEQNQGLFRYLGGYRQSVSCSELERAIDEFIEDMLNKVGGAQLASTNLHQIWMELREERADDQLSRFRKLEAQLGYDPDEANDEMIRHHLDTASELGDAAVGEIAADSVFHDREPGAISSADDLHRIAKMSGFSARPEDAVQLPGTFEEATSEATEAWRLGEGAAKRVRKQERLGGKPIGDALLAEFAGTSPNAISASDKNSEQFSFALDMENAHSNIALRPKSTTGRRFELARLIGDRLLNRKANCRTDRLFPVTGTYSYRQKMQRAFAAELLSPFDSMIEVLGGDYSEERQHEVAEHFMVSPMTIQTQLLNRRYIAPDQAPNLLGRGATV